MMVPVHWAVLDGVLFSSSSLLTAVSADKILNLLHDLLLVIVVSLNPYFSVTSVYSNQEQPHEVHTGISSAVNAKNQNYGNNVSKRLLV